MSYFSERELATKPRTDEEITPKAWRELTSAITARIADGSFAKTFPSVCDTGAAVVATDHEEMALAVRSEFPYLEWPLTAEAVPSTYDVLDLVEFCHSRVAKSVAEESSFFCWPDEPEQSHKHLAFEVEKGREDFRAVVNRIFIRNRLVYELQLSGQVTRLAPAVLSEALNYALFSTGDAALNELLERARMMFLSHDPKVRKDGLEKLWDAWERLKTIEKPQDKRDSIRILLDKVASEPPFRQTLEDEANALNSVGNSYMIRHTEIGKCPITSTEQVDYLFHRMFALIRLLLRSTGRGA